MTQFRPRPRRKSAGRKSTVGCDSRLHHSLRGEGDDSSLSGWVQGLRPRVLCPARPSRRDALQIVRGAKGIAGHEVLGEAADHWPEARAEVRPVHRRPAVDSVLFSGAPLEVMGKNEAMKVMLRKSDELPQTAIDRLLAFTAKLAGALSGLPYRDTGPLRRER